MQWGFMMNDTDTDQRLAALVAALFDAGAIGVDAQITRHGTWRVSVTRRVDEEKKINHDWNYG